MTEKKPHISIVSPVYMGEKMVSELVRRIKESVETITENFDIILVNDASPDASWEAIEQACANDKRVKGINLSRNFGQHYAITAGLNYAQGDWVVVMDCDLQDRPEEIPNLYKKAQEGWESVFAQRKERKDSFLKRFFSRFFYMLFSYLTDTKQDPTVANFGLYHSKVIKSVLQMKDQIRFFPTMIQWVGYKKYYLPVQHEQRSEGKSTYNLKSLLNLAINSVLAFSDKPLRIIVKLGFFITVFSLLVSVLYFSMYIMGSIEMLGFTSLILSVWLLSGMIIFIVGFTGLYIGKIFEKVKQRPHYIVSEKINV